ncbi:MAG: MucBP domain-containing protein [Streptococcus sanguinis]|nr:MucBP domain-containing protein [Streptococcus sanguinis]
MKKTLGKKVEMGMKLVPIPLSLLLAGTMAVTVQAEEVSSETEGNQVQNNQTTPPVNQELPNDGTIKNTPAEEASGLTISEEGEKGVAQVSPEIKQLAQEFYDYHTKENSSEITKAANFTSVMPEMQSNEQIQEAAKKYDRAYAIRKIDGVFKYIDLKQVENLNLVRDEDFRDVGSRRATVIQNDTALFFLNKWESTLNVNPTPEEVAKIPKAIIPRSELDLMLDDTIPRRTYLRRSYWLENSNVSFDIGFSRKYFDNSDNRVLSRQEIRQILSENPDMFRIEAWTENFPFLMNPFFQKLLVNGKEVKEYRDLYNSRVNAMQTDPRNYDNAGYHLRNKPFDYSTMMPLYPDLGNYNGRWKEYGEVHENGNIVYIDWLGNNPSLVKPWFGENNIKTFHYKLYLMKPGDKTRYYIDRDYTIEIMGVPDMTETSDGGVEIVKPSFSRTGYSRTGFSPNKDELDKLFRTVKAEGFVFKVSDVKKVNERETGPGKVLVRYQDEQGHAIANPIMDEKPAKTRYTVSPKPLISYNNKFYTYKSRLTVYDAESGEYAAGRTKEIVYEYELSQFQLPDETGQELSDSERGLVASKSITGYDFQSSTDEDGVRTHIYRASVHELPTDAPREEKPVLEMTRFVDETGQELSDPERGLVASKSIAGYDFQSSTDEDGVRTHVYRASVHELPTDAPREEKPVLEMTRFVDESGQELSAPERGLVASKSIAGYDFQSSNDEDGIRTHVYRASVHEVPKDAPIVDKPAIEITRFLDVDGRPLAAAEFGLLDAKNLEEYGFVSVSEANGVRTYVYAPKTKTQIAFGTETSEQKSPVRVENSETTPVLSRVSKHTLPNTGNTNSSFLGAAIISLLASVGLLHSKKERKK